MMQWCSEDDAAIRSATRADSAPGLEGQPRVNMATLEVSLPSLVDLAVRGPVVLTRHGREAFVLVPLDIWQRVWLSGQRPPLVDATAEPEQGSNKHARPGSTGGSDRATPRP